MATGGVARPQSYELTGPLATGVLEQVTLDIAFLGVDGIDAVAGAMAHHEGEASINRLMAERAAQVVVVADSSKVGRRAFARICTAAEVDVLVTDTGIAAAEAARLADAGVKRCHRLSEAPPGAAAPGGALDLLVIGDCNPDVMVVGGDVTPAFGQQEKLVDGISLEIGGSASITAVAAARLGLRVALAAAVGDDPAGRFMLAQLAAEGVDTTAGGGAPGRAHRDDRGVVAGGDRAILTATGAVATLTARDVPAALLVRARHVHVSSYFLLAGSLGPGLAALLAAARPPGRSTSLDTNWDPAERWAGPAAGRGARAGQPAAAERGGGAALAGAPDLAAGRGRWPRPARRWSSSSASAARCAWTGTRRYLVEPPPVTVSDTTGAGDCFNAGRHRRAAGRPGPARGGRARLRRRRRCPPVRRAAPRAAPSLATAQALARGVTVREVTAAEP